MFGLASDLEPNNPNTSHEGDEDACSEYAGIDLADLPDMPKQE
jgi:hypothetical protein